MPGFKPGGTPGARTLCRVLLPAPDLGISPHFLPQLGPALVHRDPRWHCERAFSLSFADGRVQLFFIDTSPMMSFYRDTSWAGNPGLLHSRMRAVVVQE